MAGNRAADPSGFDGLEGVSDDELEAAVERTTSGDRSGQSQSATPQSEDPAGSTIEGTEGGEPAKQGLLQMLGYETEEVAAQSVRNLRNYASQTKDEAETLRSENARLKAQLGVAPQAPAAPASDPLSILEKDFFVPREILGPAVESLVQKQLTAYLQPLVVQQEADKKMVAKYGPEYERIKPRLDSFIEGNAHVSEMVRLANERGIPEVGREFALGAFREAVALASHGSIQEGAEAAANAKNRGRESAAPLQGRENTRTRLAQAQSGGTSGIDMAEAIAQANAGNDRLLNEVFASRLPSEEAMERALRGH